MPRNISRLFSPTVGLYAPFPYRYVDSERDPGHITLNQRDSVYINQMGLSEPLGLDASSYQASGILDRWLSGSVGRKLTKVGVVDDKGMVHTDKIDKHFTHHLAEIGAFRQKQIIDMLFWWEEEVMRLKKLQAEKKELEEAIAAVTNAEEQVLFKKMLDRVEGKIRAQPSLRNDALERNEDALMVNFRREYVDPPQEQYPGTVVGEHQGEELPPYTR